MPVFKASGKLLISAEYAVLDGALALAVPCRFGQRLKVDYQEITDNPQLKWQALLSDGSTWFSAVYDLKKMELIESDDIPSARRLLDIFKKIEILSPGFFSYKKRNVSCTTQLEFPKDWGLGSSSTLIALLAQFSNTDAFELNRLSFNTSGYDVACAFAEKPLFYQLKNDQRLIETVEFNPDFKDSLFFVHLNQKQDTAKSVAEIYKNSKPDTDWLNGISALTFRMQQCQSLTEFEQLIDLHEEMIASKTGQAKVKSLNFPDYSGSIKSLGAWGGDFVMVTARENFREYFRSKGYHTILSFDEMVL